MESHFSLCPKLTLHLPITSELDTSPIPNIGHPEMRQPRNPQSEGSRQRCVQSALWTQETAGGGQGGKATLELVPDTHPGPVTSPLYASASS